MTDHDLLIFLTDVTLLVIAARLGGEIAARLSIPTVVGEIVAGICLGPTVLGQIWGAGWEVLFPTDASIRAGLDALSWIGVLFIVLNAGLRTRLGLLRDARHSVVLAWAGGFLLPFSLGFALGLVMPVGFIGPGIDRAVFALFIATAMSISAIPVIARILTDVGLIQTRVGALVMTTALADDTIGWLMLALAAGFVDGDHTSSLGLTIAGLVLFAVIAPTLGQRAIRIAFANVDRLHIQHAQMGLIVVLILIGGLITQALGVHLVLGAFVTAVMIGRVGRRDRSVDLALERVGLSFFAPFFFAYMGSKVDLTSLRGSYAGAAAAALIVACVSKFVGGGVGARLGGLPRWESMAVGVGLNARGAMELVIAAVGSSLGIITPPMYATIVMIAVVTSLMASPLLRYCASRFGPEAWEKKADGLSGGESVSG